MRRGLFVGALIVFLIGAPISFRIATGTNAKVVDIAPAQMRTISPSVLASGILTYESQITLVSEVLAQVESVSVKAGDHVTKGQVLAVLDAGGAAAEVEQAQANSSQSDLNKRRAKMRLEAAEKTLARYEELGKSGMVALTKIDDLVAQVDAAKVELTISEQSQKQAEAQLTQARYRQQKHLIRSPIDGMVVQVSIKAGETAVPSAMSIAGGSLMVIANTSNMFAEVNVDEADIARVASGQAVMVSPAASVLPIKGVVDQVALAPRQEATQGRTYAVKIKLIEAESARFFPGMSARAEIVSLDSKVTRLAVPVQAIRYPDLDATGTSAKPLVFVAQAGVVTARNVVTGVADDSHVEVTSGLMQGEMVVVGPARILRFLHDGDRVSASASPTEPTAQGSRR